MCHINLSLSHWRIDVLLTRKRHNTPRDVGDITPIHLKTQLKRLHVLDLATKTTKVIKRDVFIDYKRRSFCTAIHPIGENYKPKTGLYNSQYAHIIINFVVFVFFVAKKLCPNCWIGA